MFTNVKWGDYMYKKIDAVSFCRNSDNYFFEQTTKPAIVQEPLRLFLKHNLNSSKAMKGGTFNG